jgi:hypothetical protein
MKPPLKNLLYIEYASSNREIVLRMPRAWLRTTLAFFGF